MTMQCEKCGDAMKIDREGDSRPSMMDKSMRTYTRLRACACGEHRKSVEVWQSDLAELRRKAYLHELAQAKRAA